jgi:hypothetical protein
VAEIEDPDAPHGRDEDGKPLAPYGYRQDGRPKLSNRGRQPAPPKKADKKKEQPKKPAAAGSSAAQKQALVDFADTLLVPAAIGLSAPPTVAKLGEQRAMAAAGSVFIVKAHVDPVADALVAIAAERPGMLSWLDTVSDKMPWIMLLKSLGDMGKALWGNWKKPDPRLAAAATQYGVMRSLQMAAAIEQEAAEMGLFDQEVTDVQEQARQEPSEANGWTEFASAA